MSEELARLRARIDELDEAMLRLLNERAQLAQSIGHLKTGPIYRPEREAQVVRRLQGLNAGPLPGESVEWLFKEIMSACRALEQPMTVAYLGPEGTFSEAAAIKQFGHASRGLPMASIDDVFHAVERGEAVYGVAPVENSTEGAVSRTLDLLLSSPLRICGEVMLRVRQHLMRAPVAGAGLEGVGTVYSHSQSLAQCHEWLNQHLPQARRVPVSSNAEAARMAAADPAAAAIGGANAAEHFGLAIVERDIEDEPNNTTRFLVLGRDEVAPSGRDKTSVVLTTRNRPGALLDLLTPFAADGIGLTKLESRPARNAMWEYIFYLDIEGHGTDAKVRHALQTVEKHAIFLKVLGSYPIANS